MNKRTTKMLLLIGLAVLLALPVFSFAQQGPPDGRGYGRGQGQGGRGPGMGMMNINTEDLKLTSEQQALYDKMKSAAEAHFNQKQEFRQERRGSFRDEMKKDNPNFVAVANKIKAERKAELEAFNDMIDAKAAFFTSLTDEQLKVLADQRPMRGQRGRGGQGRGNRGGGGYGWNNNSNR